MVKIFKYKHLEDVEKRINQWIDDNPTFKLIDIKYQALKEEGEIWHFALVIYE